MGVQVNFFKLASSLALIFLISACTQKNTGRNSVNRAGIDPAPQNQAAPQPSQSFSVAETQKAAEKKENAKSDNGNSPADKASPQEDRSHVVIKKSALGKEFLLSVNMLTQVPTPSFTSLQSRVISFIERDGKVYVLDVTGNNVVGTGNIPQNLLIAELPVLKDTDAELEVDFNSGMNQVFTVADMFGSDDFDGNAKYDMTAAKVNISYIDEITLTDESYFIRQVAQIEDKDGMQPVEVRYQIKPYRPDPEFEPTKAPDLTKVGYFESNPLMLKDGTTITYAMKWNNKKKIKFAISANTPAKYRELFKSSLLYWNKILGEDAIEVTQLEDKSITAPRFDTNILQWVDYDGSGAAFADAHVDPRSGEVTSAQIFMPSAFFHDAVARRIRVNEASHSKLFSIKGFKPSTLCRRNLMKDLNTREMDLDISEAALEKATEDYVYEVIAHELGHVLGLRHNFAGSLAATYDFKDRKEILRSYYKNKKAPEGVVTSSSVMEYSRFDESAINGDLFRNGSRALTYDEMAMNVLYKGAKVPQENRPLFCTDSDHDKYVDCSMSDAGKSAISSAAGTYQAEINAIAARAMNKYISMSKYADDSNADLIPVAEVNLNPKDAVTRAGLEFAKLVSTLKQSAHFVAVVNPNLPVLAVNKPEIEKKEKEYVQSEFARLGGLETMADAMPEDLDQQIVEKFSALLEDPMYSSGTRSDGTQYSFSDEEKAVMLEQVKKYAVAVKEALILNEVKALSGAEFEFPNHGQSASEDQVPWADNDVTYGMAALNLKRFDRYVISKNGDESISAKYSLKTGEEKTVSLPVYRYPQNIRLAATELFSAPHKAVDWGYIEKRKAAALLSPDLELVGDLDSIDLSTLDRTALQWILNNSKISGNME
jgi:hypothetical protein